MKPSDDIIEFIKGWEDCRLKPYLDQAGKWTVGWGDLMGPDEDTSAAITQKEADRRFDIKLTELAQKLTIYINRPLEQREFDAVLSLVYNIGLRAFMNSTLRQCLWDENYDGAATQFARWNKVKIKGKLQISNGLVKRREAERRIFVFADYSGRP